MSSDPFKRDTPRRKAGSSPQKPAEPSWQSDALFGDADESVFERTTEVPPLPEESAAGVQQKPSARTEDEPPTKPQTKVGSGWSVPAEPPGVSSYPPPTPRASFPRLSLEPDAAASTPLGLADVNAQGPALAAPPAMSAKAESVPPLPSFADAGQQMQACYEVGDFSGSLTAAEVILEHTPDDPEANRYAQSSREVLTQMFSARLAPLDRTVTVAISPEQIRWLSLDHKSGFLLSLVDGTCTIEELLDISGMSRLDALRILFTLTQQKVIALT